MGPSDPILFFFLGEGAIYVAQVDHDLFILLLLTPEYWNEGCVLPCPAFQLFISVLKVRFPNTITQQKKLRLKETSSLALNKAKEEVSQQADTEVQS